MDKWWRPMSPSKLNWYITNFFFSDLNIDCLNLGVSNGYENIFEQIIALKKSWFCLRLCIDIIALKGSRVNCSKGIWIPKKDSTRRFCSLNCWRYLEQYSEQINNLFMVGIWSGNMSFLLISYIRFSQALSGNITPTCARGVYFS